MRADLCIILRVTELFNQRVDKQHDLRGMTDRLTDRMYKKFMRTGLHNEDMQKDKQ